MHIVHVTASLSRLGGGVSPVVWSLARHLADRDASTCVAGLSDAHTVEDSEPQEKVSVYASPVVGPRALGYSPGLRRCLETETARVDIVHSHGLWMCPGREARRLAQQAQVPLLISIHGMLEPWAVQRSRWKKKLAGWLFENRNITAASCLHALCDAEAQNLRALGLRNPIAVVPNGVELEPFDALPTRELAWTLWPDLRDQRLVLFLGRIHPKKGLLNLIAAWDTLADQFPEWRLVIAGPDSVGHLSEVQAAVRRTGRSQSVTFTGSVQNRNKLALLAAADVFSLPSFSEGFSVAVLEALASRLPVLITRGCNFDEVADAGAGIIAEPAMESIAEGLTDLLRADTVRRAQMGDKGRTLVSKNYAWPHIAEQMLRVYQWVLHRADKPDFVRLN